MSIELTEQYESVEEFAEYNEEMVDFFRKRRNVLYLHQDLDYAKEIARLDISEQQYEQFKDEFEDGETTQITDSLEKYSIGGVEQGQSISVSLLNPQNTDYKPRMVITQNNIAEESEEVPTQRNTHTLRGVKQFLHNE